MKNKINHHYVIAVVFICLIFTVCAGTAIKIYDGREGYRNIYIAYLNGNTGITSKVKSLILTAYETIESVDDKIFERNGFINVYGFAQKVVGSKYVYDPVDSSNNIVKLGNGSLSFIMKKADDLSLKADQTANLHAVLKTKGIQLLYVQLPCKINEFNNQLPKGIYDYSAENMNQMITALKIRGVATFDLREEIHRDGLDYNSIFFRTDHHWKPETALWAADKISGKLNSDYGFQIDLTLLDKSNFSTTLYKNWFLGSQGKRVGQYFAGTDDFNLILPKYETDIICAYYGIGGLVQNRTGSFENTVIFRENFDKKNYFDSNTYQTYSGAEYCVSTYLNNNIEGKKILVIRDSFSNTLAPFFSLAACKELRTIDPRYFKDSITDYIDEFKPDAVLMLYSITALSHSEFFDFNPER